MLAVGQKVQFPSSEVEVKSLIQSSGTSFIYRGQCAEKQFMLKSVPSFTPHLQELQFQEYTNTRLIGPDPHVVSLLEQGSASTVDSKVFLLEYAEHGNLKFFLKTRELTEEQVLFIFKDIVLAIIKVNDSGIVHRDIHPGNVWIDSGFHFRLSGFERSIRVDDPRQINVKMNSLKLTHPDFRPPDLDEGVQLNKVDVWGLGCLLFYLVYRSVPFSDKVEDKGTSPLLQEILSSCFQADPADRPFPRKILNMLASQGLPVFNPSLMPTKKPIKCSKYSAKYSISTLVNSSTDAPDLFYLQQISFKTWTETSSIRIILKHVGSLVSGVTLNDLKILIIIHRLMLSGPNEMLCADLSETFDKILQTWTNNEKKTEDGYFCEFYNGLIRQVTRNLIEKVRFHNRNRTNCNWKTQIPQDDFKEAVGYLAKVIRICEGLKMGMDILPQINSFLAMQLIEECQRLMMCIKSLDATNELQNFNNRLSALTFDPPVVKKSNFETGKVKILSPRNEVNSKSNTNPKLIPSPNAYPDLPSPIDLPKPDFSKSAVNFSQYPKEEKPAKMDFSDLLSMDLLDIKKPAIIKTDKSPPDPFQMNNAIKVNENIPVKIEVNEFIQPTKPVNEEFLLIDQRISAPSNSRKKDSNANLPEHPNRSNSNNIKKRHSSSSIQLELINPQIPSNKNPVIQPVPPRVIVNKSPQKPKPANILEIDKRWVIQQKDIKLGPILGEGASCTVYRGEYKRTPVAIKIMMGSYAGQNIIQEFTREVTAMITLRHPNLVLFMGASVDPQMMIISEFCSGESLFKLLHEKKNVHLSWNQKFKMIIDIARGMLYLHEAQPPILHRDLKSLNLLLMDQVNGQNDFVLVKVTDFGIARILDEVAPRITMQVGTCHWMAPEVMNSQPYSFPADIYSFGIVLWEIAARETPYKDLKPYEIPDRVLKGVRPDLNKIAPGVPPGIKDLIVHCWDQSPQNRPTFRQIIGILEQIQGPFDY